MSDQQPPRVYDVFITYRRIGGFELARLIYEDLRQRGYSPFMDIEDLRSGPFNTALYQRIEEANDVVVVLSAGALDPREGEDWLHLEVAHAFVSNKSVVPVLTRDFDWPAQLSDDIAELRYQQGVPPSGADYFDASLDRLARLLHPPARSHSKLFRRLPDWLKGRRPLLRISISISVGILGLLLVLPLVHRSAYHSLDRRHQTTSVNENAPGGPRAGSSDSAIERLLDEARRGDKDAQYRLALAYEAGDGLVRSDVQALKWLQRAAKNGHVEAQYELSKRYDAGKGLAADAQQAAAWLRKAAEAGSADAQLDLAIQYARGKKDPGEAERWYRSAAEQGNVYAQYKLGRGYASGWLLRPNDREAVRWFEKAADQGYGWAQSDLGLMYEKGRGVEQSDARAVEWYRKAAEQGISIAQYKLGLMYEAGKGVPKSDAEAVGWYRKAAEQGYEPAKRKLPGTEPTNVEFTEKGVSKPALSPEILKRYKIDIYFDEDSDRDSEAAGHIKENLVRREIGQEVVLVPRTAGFSAVGNPVAYEVRYDSDSEREAASALAAILNEADSSLRLHAIGTELQNKTPNTLSIFLFSEVGKGGPSDE
jgi:hypothetical protein